MTVYPWLTLRNRTYYLRAPVPADLHESLKKTQIWKSLGTQDRRRAIEKLRIESAVVSQLFEDERRRQARLNEPPLEELTDAQIKIIGDVYFAHLLDEDEERRLGGFEGDDFDNAADWLDDLDKDNRHEAARGIMSPFMLDEAAEVLSWDGTRLTAHHVTSAHLTGEAVSQKFLLLMRPSSSVRSHPQIWSSLRRPNRLVANHRIGSPVPFRIAIRASQGA